MPRFFTLPSLLFLFAALVLNAQELPLFPSQKLPVELKSKDGEVITAIIHDVWPEQQSARIFVEERRDVFVIPFDLLDEDSLAKLQDWFYKRLIGEQLSIRNEDLPAENNDRLLNPNGNPNSQTSYRDRQSISTNERKRKIRSNIYNSSAYTIENLHIVYGIFTSTNYRDTGLNTPQPSTEAFYTSEHSIRQLQPRESLSLSSPAVLLKTISISYYTKRTIIRPMGGGTYEQDIRRNRQENDRISGSYTLIYYKGELVAGVATRSSLVSESLQYRRKASNSR